MTAPYRVLEWSKGDRWTITKDNLPTLEAAREVRAKLLLAGKQVIIKGAGE